MRNAELGINSIRISSAFRIPHSEFRKPVAWATNAITEGRARFRIGTQWFSRSGLRRACLWGLEPETAEAVKTVEKPA